MANFIKEFLEKNSKKNLNIDNKKEMLSDNKKNENKESIENIKNWIDEKDKEISEIWDFLEDDISKNSKELEKDVEVVKSLREPIFTEPKEKIVIQKISYTKTWIWIIIQFIVWFSLLYVSNAYLQTHEPEKKFFDSSVEYWKNMISSLVNKLGWPFSDEVERDYIDKRWKMILDLANMEVELKNCKLKEKNSKNIAWKKDIEKKVKRLKKFVSNEKAFTLNEFIDKYQEFDLWVHSYKTQVEDYCKK